MKKILICLMLVMLLIPLVSAFEFDDRKYYDSEIREFKVVNAFGLGSDIVSARLISSQEVHVLPGWKKVATIQADVYDKKELIENIQFYDYTNKGALIASNYEIVYIEDKGRLAIELWATVNQGDRVEWIPTIYGYKVEEWAIFIGATKYESFEGPFDNFNRVGTNTHAVTFRASNTYTFNGVGIYGQKLSLPTLMDVFICEVNSSGSPDCSTVLSSNVTTDVNDFAGGLAWFNITMPNFQMSEGTNYSLVLNASTSDLFDWRYNSTLGVYTQGDCNYTSANNGSTWSRVDPERAFGFQVWGDGTGIDMSLKAPANDSVIINPTQNFTSNHTGLSSYKVTNISYHFWWELNGTRFNQTNLTNDLSRNESEINLTSIVFGNFKWNIFVCANNSATTECKFTDNNRTFSRKVFNTTAKNHSILTTEGNSETFKLNITLIAGQQLSVGNLVYNNTEYSGTFIGYIFKSLEYAGRGLRPTNEYPENN